MPKATPKKSRRNTSTPASHNNNKNNNNNNNNNNSRSSSTISKRNKTPKTKSRSQTPNHKLVSANANANANTNTPQITKTKTQTEEQQQQLSPKTKQAFHDALEDVHTRFILNLPEEELTSSDRLFFQIEQAWWFYEDFICDEMDQDINHNDASQSQSSSPTKLSSNAISYANILTNDGSTHTSSNDKIEYPRYSNLKPFARKMFEISPILSPHVNQFDTLWKDFAKYRRKISTYGTILLDESCTKIVLCQDYKTKAWTLPAGKVNQNEKGIDAAIRETYEETGFDINCESGLTKQCQFHEDHHDGGGGDDDNYDYDDYDNNALRRTWNQLSEDDSLVYIENDGSGKRRTCFICHGVPEDFPFAPIVRKEVADIEWHYLDDLPKKTFAILPFMKGLRKWIRQKNAKKKQGKRKNTSSGSCSTKKKREQSKKKERKTTSNKRQQKQQMRSGSKGRGGNYSDQSLVTSEDDDLVQSGLGQIGDQNRWSEDDMFRVNEELIGRKIEYDGNPQQFATKGFNGIDPHAFRIVGGGFMNSGGNEIAKAPEKSKMQPLFRPNDEDYDDDGNENHDSNGNNRDEGTELTPFFGNDGSTPWGEQVFESRKNDAAVRNNRAESQSESFECRTNSDTMSQGSIPSASELEDTLFSGDGGGSSSSGKITFDPTKKSSGLSFLTKLRGESKGKKVESERIIPASAPSDQDGESQTNTMDEVFMTDKEITAKSQRKKRVALVEKIEKVEDESTKSDNVSESTETKEDSKQRKSYGKTKITEESKNKNLVFLQNWVKSLPQARPTKVFGDFHFDVDAIMVAVRAKS